MYKAYFLAKNRFLGKYAFSKLFNFTTLEKNWLQPYERYTYIIGKRRRTLYYTLNKNVAKFVSNKFDLIIINAILRVENENEDKRSVYFFIKKVKNV